MEARRVIAPVLCATALALAQAGSAQVLDTHLWGTNGSVTTIARAGNTLFIGGGFSTVGPCMGSGLPVDPTTGEPLSPFPLVNGGVNSAVPDGGGGWYIGGRFSTVGGAPHAGLAHILADGRVEDWGPPVAGTGYLIRTWRLERRSAGVNVIALQGRTLFVAGLFDSVAGHVRHNLAAVDAVTGALLDWDPDVDSEVYAMAVRRRTVFVGGEFTHVGSQVRAFIGAVDARTGAPTAWSPMANDRVQALVVDGSSVWAGGDFGAIGGQPRNTIAELDAETGLATAWDAAVEPHRHYIAHGDYVWPAVSALAVQGHTVYAGGRWESTHGQPCDIVTALDTRTGWKTGFNPSTRGGEVATLAVRGRTLYVGGALYWFGNEVRVNVAALDAETGKALTWDPRADGVVVSLTATEKAVYVGGAFTSLHDWQPRNGIAALDLTTGRVTPWHPTTNGGVQELAVRGNTVYMVGGFSLVDGQPHQDLAAVDAVTGALTGWDPGGIPGATYPLGPRVIATDRAVFVAGYFQTLGGLGRTDLAALDPVTGAATPWDARLDDLVASMLLRDDTLYVAGLFQQAAGQPHRWMAALDARTAALLPWDPLPGWNTAFGVALAPVITALAAHGSVVYVGGSFTNMGGVPRTDLAAVDATTGALLPWRADIGGDWQATNEIHVYALAAPESTVWVGGRFTTVAGQPMPYLAVLDAATGTPTRWQPHADGMVEAFCGSGDTLYVGGMFRNIAGLPHSGLAAFVIGGASTAPSASSGPQRHGWPALLAPVWPNPVQADAALELALPASAMVDLTVFDVQGRRVMSVLQHQSLDAGLHRFRLDASQWSPGVYLCRLDVAGRCQTRKLLRVR